MNIREMYSILTQMPLLQGLNGMDLAKVEERVGISINIMEASNQPFLQQGDICNELIFLAEGKFTKKTVSEDSRFTTWEEITAPAVIEPEQLYGLTCKYNSTYFTKTRCSMFTVSKINVTNHLMHLDIFRINYMNMLSAQIHKLRRQNTNKYGENARQKLITFLNCNFMQTEGEKNIQIKMRDLAEYIGETRLTVSCILNEMNKEGQIELKRMGIKIQNIKLLH